MLNVTIGYTFGLKCESQNTNQNSLNCLNISFEGGDMKTKGISKRRDGRYMVRKMVDGERITQYAHTLAEAKSILQKINTGKLKLTKKERAKNYTFKEYSEQWLELYKKPFIKPKSYSAIKGFVVRINKAIGNIRLKDITTKILQEYMNTLEKNRAKEKIAIYLNAILQKAVDTAIIQHNAFRAVIKDKKIKFKNYAYTYAEQQKILEIIKGTDIEHEIMIYLMCGCRPNELPKRKDFDFLNNIINIHGTKNENALHREVEMSEEFASYIKKYFDQRDTQAELYVSRKFIDLCNQAGIKKPLLYRLRHTFATNHFTLGTPPKYVQQWMGHADISMTLDTYTDIDKTASKEKIKKLYNNFYYIVE